MLFERFLYGSGKDIYSHLVVTTLRHYDICIPLGRLYKLKVHRFYRLMISPQYPLHGLASLFDISSDDSSETVVCIGIHKDQNIKHAPELLVGEDEDTLHYYHLRRLDMDGLALWS